MNQKAQLVRPLAQNHKKATAGNTLLKVKINYCNVNQKVYHYDNSHFEALLRLVDALH